MPPEAAASRWSWDIRGMARRSGGYLALLCGRGTLCQTPLPGTVSSTPLLRLPVLAVRPVCRRLTGPRWRPRATPWPLQGATPIFGECPRVSCGSPNTSADYRVIARLSQTQIVRFCARDDQVRRGAGPHTDPVRDPPADPVGQAAPGVLQRERPPSFPSAARAPAHATRHRPGHATRPPGLTRTGSTGSAAAAPRSSPARTRAASWRPSAPVAAWSAAR